MTRKWSLAALLLTVVHVAAFGASTFVSSNSTHNLTFSIVLPDAPRDPDTFGFYLSAPHGNSWIAVGFGDEMNDSFMLVAYTDTSGKNVTLSPRLGTGHVEPSYYKNSTMSIEIKDCAIRDGRYVINAICHSCRSWRTGSIDFNSKRQAMIYAVGSDEMRLNSNAQDAGLRRHDYYGTFKIDMVAAKGDPSLFPPKDLSATNSTDFKEHNDHEYSSSIHRVVMVGTFVALFPIGVFYKTILGNIRWHYYTQIFGILVVIVGSGLGVALSRSYERSKHYNHPHQLIGVVVLVLILLQATLGGLHHRIFEAKQKPTIMGIIHRVLGPVAILFGIINGFLGFNFALTPRRNIGYAIVIIIVLLLLCGAALFQMRRRRRQEAYKTPAAHNFLNAYNAPSSTTDIPLQPSFGQPHAYGRPPGA